MPTLADLKLQAEFDIPFNTKRDDWPCVGWRVRFSKVNKTGPVGPIVEFEHFTGTGIYKDAAVARRSAPPDPVEILHCIAMDGRAVDQTFEDWACEFGYDPDSRKAEKIYKACIDNGRKLALILSPELIEELAALEY